MANHIRLDGTPDPMESMYTSGFSIDLTKNNKNLRKVAENAEMTGLESLNASKEEITEAKEKKLTATVITDAAMSQDVQEFDPTTIVPKKEKVDVGANEIFSALDAAVEREKKSLDERYQKLEEAMYEDYLNKDDEEQSVADPTTAKKAYVDIAVGDDDDLFETATKSTTGDAEKTYKVYEKENDAFPTQDAKFDLEPLMNANKEEEKAVSIKRSVSDEIAYDEDEVDSDFEDTAATTKQEEKQAEDEMNDIVENLKIAARSTMRPKMNTIDLSQFKIGNKGVKSSTVILREEKDVDMADWVMYEAKHPITMSALTGPELIKLDPENSSRNRYNTLRDIYKIIYDHVVDSKKVSFDAWMKQTRYADIDHIYFALYMATFHGSNFISYQCPDCKKVFIQDVSFKEMVKYKDDTIEGKIKEIMSMSTDNGEIPYDVDLVQINDTYVFGMRSPSLYNIAMETAGLPENLLEKYADLIDTITYIDSIYVIDYTNKELTPVIIPTVKDDPVKSTAKKIKTMYNILKTLSSDEYYVLRGYISKLGELTSEISYIVPGAKCPDCDKEIPANENTSAQDLLFTRHHLGAFANL